MDASVQLVLIAAVPGIITGFIAPIVLNWLTSRSARQQREDEAKARRLDKLEDWRRQDEVADKLLAQQAIVAARAAEAIAVTKEVLVKVDGMLLDRDKANVKVGELKEAVRGADLAASLARGQQEGREAERASRESLVPASDTPIKVADEQTQDATKRAADALERTAAAAEAAGKAT